MRVLLATLGLLGAACATTPPPRRALPVAPVPTYLRPRLTLPTALAPRAVRARLEVLPASGGFAGEIELDVEVNASVSLLFLNAESLVAEEASVVVAGGERLPLGVARVEGPFLALRASRPLPVGRATLFVRYRGSWSPETGGLIRHVDDGDAYAYTHFEPVAARRVFPCFDEPRYRVPWTLSLRVPAGAAAFSNTAVDEERPLGDGTRLVTFRTTPPLASYHVAFAVGDYAIVDGPEVGEARTRARLLVPRRLAPIAAARARDAFAHLPSMIAWLETRTGVPLPFDKLDLLVRPGASLGYAQENPGLLTFHPDLLLGHDSDGRRGARRIVIAHELAHQWFGNLVTMSWWRGAWIAEGLATWVARQLAFELGLTDADADALHHAASTRSTDVMGARPVSIEKNVVRPEWIELAFDEGTYQKGAAFVGMIAEWRGNDAVWAALQGVLRAHRFESVEPKVVLEPLAGDAATMARLVDFLYAPGQLRVSAELRCDKREPTASIALRAAKPAQAVHRVVVPVCARWSGGGEVPAHSCALVEAGAEARIAIDRRAGCPRDVVVGTGAWRWFVIEPGGARGEDLRLLDAAEQRARLADAALEVGHGDRPTAGAEALALVERLRAAGDDPLLDDSLGELLWKLADLMHDADAAPFAAWLGRVVVPRLAARPARLTLDFAVAPTLWGLPWLLVEHGDAAARALVEVRGAPPPSWSSSAVEALTSLSGMPFWHTLVALTATLEVRRLGELVVELLRSPRAPPPVVRALLQVMDHRREGANHVLALVAADHTLVAAARARGVRLALLSRPCDDEGELRVRQRFQRVDGLEPTLADGARCRMLRPSLAAALAAPAGPPAAAPSEAK